MTPDARRTAWQVATWAIFLGGFFLWFALPRPAFPWPYVALILWCFAWMGCLAKGLEP